jgi:hypothetical protein
MTKVLTKKKKRYNNLPGMPDYLTNAPRIEDWEEFKGTILKLESEPQKQPDYKKLKKMDLYVKDIIQNKLDDKPKKKSGCFGSFLLLTFLFGLTLIILVTLNN